MNELNISDYKLWIVRNYKLQGKAFLEDLFPKLNVQLQCAKTCLYFLKFRPADLPVFTTEEWIDHSDHKSGPFGKLHNSEVTVFWQQIMAICLATNRKIYFQLVFNFFCFIFWVFLSFYDMQSEIYSSLTYHDLKHLRRGKKDVKATGFVAKNCRTCSVYTSCVHVV